MATEQKFALSWNELFRILGPVMLIEASEERLSESLTQALVQKLPNREGIVDPRVSEQSFNEVKVQFLALGLIRKSQKPRNVKNAASWSLTPYGESYLMQLMAIPASLPID